MSVVRPLILLLMLLLVSTTDGFVLSHHVEAYEITDTIGAPWQGEMGIIESVSQLMKRQEASRYITVPHPQRVIPFRRIPGREYAPQNPASPPVSGMPSIGGIGPLISVNPFTPQIVGPPNFLGATLADTNAFPPDTMGAVGPTQYIVAVNGRIRSFNKTTGVADGVLDTDTDIFFTSVMTPPVSSNFTTDIRIRYDRLSGRWFITMIDVPGLSATQPNRVMIAVSNGSTITSTSNFTFFYFQHDLVGTTPNADTNDFADYPTLGIDANALYIGVNVFTSAGSFRDSTGFIVRKSSVLGAGPIVVTAFRSLVPNNSSDGPFTPQGVDNYDPAATQGYFIGVSNIAFGELVLRRVSNPGSTPSISGNILITVSTTSFPLSVPHNGSTGGKKGNLDALDDRLFAAHLRNGSLWTAHNIAVDNTGFGTSLGDRDGSRWYEITNLTTIPTVAQSGTIFDSATTNPRFYWIPSIMVSGQGHAAMGFSTAGTIYYADAAIVGRLAGDVAGMMQTPPLLYTASATAYNPPGDPGTSTQPRRWGDYSYTSLDPNDDMTMWTIQEFCNSTNSYGVQVVKLLAPPPATPSSVSPSSVLQGLASVNIVVAGTSMNGSGFFDPGQGFANRISASVSGGVTVNSTSFNDPTHVTLNISTAGAALGAQTVTISNPDHQSVTSASSLLTIVGTCESISVVPMAISNATFNTFYTQTFTGSGGTSPYTFGLKGSLPTGMSFLVDTLSGTPLQVGSFPIAVTATDSMGCSSGNQIYSLAVVDATAARIQTNPGVFFQTIQSAYNSAGNGDTVQVQAIDFVETPLFSNPVTMTLSGGYDPTFSTNFAKYTSIMGSLTIAKGTVTIENVIIH